MNIRNLKKTKDKQHRRQPLPNLYKLEQASPILQLTRRLRNGTIAMLLLLLIGTEGYYIVGQTEWSYFDCFYMTVITVNTVGFEETLPIGSHVGGRTFTIILIFLSLAIHAYFISSITAFFLSEEFESLWWRRRMERLAQKQKEHTIICGAGETGVHVLQELLDSGRKVLVIDDDENRLQGLQEYLGTFPAIVGDATEEYVLQRAGIERATGLIAVLPSDKDNLFVTITARRMNPKLKIVSKGIDLNTLEKLKRAGADGVVSPNYIGGLRIAAEFIRPQVVQFLDLLTRDNDLDLYIEEIHLPPKSPYNGKALRDTDLRQRDLLVLAACSKNEKNWHYNPPPDYVFGEETTMIVMGKVAAVKAFYEEQQRYKS